MPEADGSVKMRSFAFVTECEGEPPYVLRFTGWYEDHAVRGADGRWRFASRIVRLWDGEVLKRFCEESHDQLHARRATSPSLPLRPQEPHPQDFTDESGARRGHDNGKASNAP